MEYRSGEPAKSKTERGLRDVNLGFLPSSDHFPPVFERFSEDIGALSGQIQECYRFHFTAHVSLNLIHSRNYGFRINLKTDTPVQEYSAEFAKGFCGC